MNTIYTSIAGKITSLAGRYAHAFFELALKEKKLEPLLADLSTLEEFIVESKDLQSILFQPRFKKKTQEGALQVLCEKANLNPLIFSFMRTLVQHKRLDQLDKITKMLAVLLQKYRQETEIDIAMAYALTSKQKQDLESLLQKKYGGHLIVTYIKDAALLGGIKIKVGSEVIDASLNAQLESLAVVLGSQNLKGETV